MCGSSFQFPTTSSVFIAYSLDYGGRTAATSAFVISNKGPVLQRLLVRLRCFLAGLLAKYSFYEEHFEEGRINVRNSFSPDEKISQPEARKLLLGSP